MATRTTICNSDNLFHRIHHVAYLVVILLVPSMVLLNNIISVTAAEEIHNYMPTPTTAMPVPVPAPLPLPMATGQMGSSRLGFATNEEAEAEADSSTTMTYNQIFDHIRIEKPIFRGFYEGKVGKDDKKSGKIGKIGKKDSKDSKDTKDSKDLKDSKGIKGTKGTKGITSFPPSFEPSSEPTYDGSEYVPEAHICVLTAPPIEFISRRSRTRSCCTNLEGYRRGK